jgi:hypothetical protein
MLLSVGTKHKRTTYASVFTHFSFLLSLLTRKTPDTFYYLKSEFHLIFLTIEFEFLLNNLIRSIYYRFYSSSSHYRCKRKERKTTLTNGLFLAYIQHFDKCLCDNVIRLNAQYRFISFLMIIIVEELNYLYSY